MQDKYDQAIAYLTEHPERIYYAWRTPDLSTTPPERQAHCLFQHTGKGCGCLTQIREDPDYFLAPFPEMTEEIAADERIPKRPDEIKVSDLPVFAEWQRRLDTELGREVSEPVVETTPSNESKGL